MKRLKRLKRLIEWLKRQRRKHLPSYVERWKAGWQHAATFGGDLDDLYDHAYGSSDPFDEGVRAYWRTVKYVRDYDHTLL